MSNLKYQLRLVVQCYSNIKLLESTNLLDTVKKFSFKKIV